MSWGFGDPTPIILLPGDHMKKQQQLKTIAKHLKTTGKALIPFNTVILALQPARLDGPGPVSDRSRTGPHTGPGTGRIHSLGGLGTGRFERSADFENPNYPTLLRSLVQ